MIIRLTEKSKGIEHYFETGQKSGREKTREELDKRVYLSGDLDSFSDAVRYTNKVKKWKNHYWHFTGSFASKDRSIGRKKIKDIHDTILKYYFCRYEIKKIIHASEIHYPRIQTGAMKQERLLHFHMAVSKWDHDTDNQIRIIPYRHKADRSFQSYIALNYRLEDPAYHERIEGKPTPEILAAMQTRKVPGLKKNDTVKITFPAYRKKLTELLCRVSSLNEAESLLKSQTEITSIIFKKLKRKDLKTGKLVDGEKYLQIKSSLFPKTRGINLRGKGFEELEKLYYTQKELKDRMTKGKYKPPPTTNHWKSYKKSERIAEIRRQKSIFLKHLKWWKGKALKPKNKHEKKAPIKKIDYSIFEKRYNRTFEKLLKEQHVFFVIYHKNICFEQINAYRIWEKNNNRFLVDNDQGVKIYRRLDKIALKLPNTPKKRKTAVTLALSRAHRKGWDLREMEINGSVEFKAEIKLGIIEVLQSGKFIKVKTAGSIKLPRKPKPFLNAVSQLQKDLAEKKAMDRLPKSRIKAIKTKLNPKAVIELAIAEWGLSPQDYVTLSDSSIKNTQLNEKWNVVDFLLKICNQSIVDIFPMLDELLKEQEQAETEKRLYETQDNDSTPPHFEREGLYDPPPKPKKSHMMEEDASEYIEEDEDDDYGFRP